MSIFDRFKRARKKGLPSYLAYVSAPEVKETQDMHQTLNAYVDGYKRKVYRGTHIDRVFVRAKDEIKEMTDAEIAASVRNGWTYEKQAVFLLKRCLVQEIQQPKSNVQMAEVYDFNKRLMTRAIELKISTKGQAKREDKEMRQRCGISE